MEDDYSIIEQVLEKLTVDDQESVHISKITSDLGLSPQQLDQTFQRWIGKTTLEFMDLISMDKRKELVGQSVPQDTLFASQKEKIPNSHLRRHSDFTKIIPMKEEEVDGTEGTLQIAYSFAPTPFGQVLVASTSKGVCYMAFGKGKEAIQELAASYPKAQLTPGNDASQDHLLSVFKTNWDEQPPIRLHIQGTEFQLKVWRELLKIPVGTLSTYHQLAIKLGIPQSSRAVGTAIGRNVIAYILPCHRMIQTSGHFGKYKWGNPKKPAMMGWEAVHFFNYI